MQQASRKFAGGSSSVSDGQLLHFGGQLSVQGCGAERCLREEEPFRNEADLDINARLVNGNSSSYDQSGETDSLALHIGSSLRIYIGVDDVFMKKLAYFILFGYEDLDTTLHAQRSFD